MDTRRRCCFRCPATGACHSIIRAKDCTGGNTPQIVEHQSPGQVFTWTGTGNFTRTTPGQTLTYGYSGNGIIGVALSNDPFTQQDVSDRYGLSSYDDVSIGTPTQGTDGVYRAAFTGENTIETGGPNVVARATRGIGGSSAGVLINLVSDVDAAVDFCGSETVVTPDGCINGNFQLSDSEVIRSGARTASNDGSSHTGLEESRCDGDLLSRGEGTASVTLSIVEMSPTFMDGTDGGFNCSGDAPSEPPPVNPADAAIEAHLARDPVHQCRSCGDK